MYLLYLDESGHPQDPSTNFFVLAGFAVFERTTHWVETHMNPIAERFNKLDPSAIEFHGSPMYSAKDDWNGQSCLRAEIANSLNAFQAPGA